MGKKPESDYGGGEAPGRGQSNLGSVTRGLLGTDGVSGAAPRLLHRLLNVTFPAWRGMIW